jgi:hypothetical protein
MQISNYIIYYKYVCTTTLLHSLNKHCEATLSDWVTLMICSSPNIFGDTSNSFCTESSMYIRDCFEQICLIFTKTYELTLFFLNLSTEYKKVQICTKNFFVFLF